MMASGKTRASRRLYATIQLKKEERDRPGRSRRRPADGFEASERSPNCAQVRRVRVFGGTPKTAGETPALLKSN